MAPGRLLEELSACERRVWDALVTGDASADRALLDEGFLGVYPDGFAGREAHVRQLAAGPTVSHYALSDMRVLPLGEDHALLAYRARYVRASGGGEEEMYVSSVWRRVPGGWVNLFSQDTPATGEALP
jgi:hypothetical protein